MELISQNRSGREPCPETDPAEYLDGPVSAKQIEITCDAGDFLPLDTIIEFQGEFKKRDRYDTENIIKSLVKYGINFPFFIWRDQGINYCLDGHGRKIALAQLLNRGYTIPDIPVVFIYAKDRAEAVRKLLHLNSRYGTITKDSVADFIGEIFVDLSELSIPDIDTIEFVDIPKNLGDIFIEEKPRKEKPIKRCPYCGGILK